MMRHKGLSAALILLLVAVSVLVIPPVKAEVNYDIEKDDPAGDATGMNPIAPYRDYVDIVHLSSKLNGTYITFEFNVTGVILLGPPPDGSLLMTSYVIYVDVDGNKDPDWTITSGYNGFIFYGNNTVMSSADDETIYSDLNATGNGTDTYRLNVPLDHFGQVTDFDFYVEANIGGATSSSLMISISDTAPDEKWLPLDPNEDTDGDGMPNGWEEEHSLDPTDPSDADDDLDGDGYTNLQEYQNNTDPQDPYSYPEGGEETKDTSIIITIDRPEEWETITADATNPLATYHVTGSVSYEGTITAVKWRIPTGYIPQIKEWQDATDTSSDGSFSTFSFDFPIGSYQSTYAMPEGNNVLQVKAITSDNKYNMAQVNFTFEYPETGGGGGGGGGGGSGGEEEGSNNVDPGTETPTDTSISIKITGYRYHVKIQGNMIYYDSKMTGTTNGVHHVKLCFVTYYKDGTKDVSEWIEEFNYDGEMGSGSILHFKPTSANWKTWEFVTKYSMEKSEESEDPAEVDHYVIYARAYKDAEETKWNQDSIKVSFKEKAPNEYEVVVEKTGEKGGGAGTGLLIGIAVIVIVAIVAVVIMLQQKKKGKENSLE